MSLRLDPNSSTTQVFHSKQLKSLWMFRPLAGKLDIQHWGTQIRRNLGQKPSVRHFLPARRIINFFFVSDATTHNPAINFTSKNVVQAESSKMINHQNARNVFLHDIKIIFTHAPSSPVLGFQMKKVFTSLKISDWRHRNTENMFRD